MFSPGVFSDILAHALNTFCVQNIVADNQNVLPVFGLVVNFKTSFIALAMQEIPDPVELPKHQLFLAPPGSKEASHLRILIQDMALVLRSLEEKKIVHFRITPANIVYSQSLNHFFLGK